MAANRPNLGLQIALILFVLITIALAVSTFMFFKENQEAQLARKNAEVETGKAKDEKVAIEKEIDKIKTIVGKGAQDKVDGILEEFKSDMTIYAATHLDPAKTYPLAMRSLVDKLMKLQDQIADKEAQNRKLAAEKQDALAEIVATTQKWEARVNAQTNDWKADQLAFNKWHKQQVVLHAGLTRRIEDKNRDIAGKEVQAAVEKKSLQGALEDQNKKLRSAQTVLRQYHHDPWESPAGKVVRVNQREHTVYINLGQADGIRRQMSFTIYDASVGNVAGKKAESKGAIEVIRILGPHQAEATITEDEIKNPILIDDKIGSPTFLPGQAQHFAIAGFIDIDGDRQSDLKQLMTLVGNNGGLVDAYIDDNGKRFGKLTPAVKMVVVEARPFDGPDSADAAKTFDRMLKEAEAAQVATMRLGDFLQYMGYQGRQRSTPLTGGTPATPKAPNDDEESTFRKRP